MTGTVSINAVFPTGTIPRIFRAAFSQIMAMQTGVLYASISGKKKAAYSTKKTG